MGVDISLTPLPAIEILSSLGVTLSMINMRALPCLVSCFAVFSCCLLEACSFFKGNNRDVDLEESGEVGGLGRLDGVETVVRLYSMREEFIFNFKKFYYVNIILDCLGYLRNNVLL